MEVVPKATSEIEAEIVQKIGISPEQKGLFEILLPYWSRGGSIGLKPGKNADRWILSIHPHPSCNYDSRYNLARWKKELSPLGIEGLVDEDGEMCATGKAG